MGEFYLKILLKNIIKKKMTKKSLILLIVNFAIIDKRLIDNIIYALLRAERIGFKEYVCEFFHNYSLEALQCCIANAFHENSSRIQSVFMK